MTLQLEMGKKYCVGAEPLCGGEEESAEEATQSGDSGVEWAGIRRHVHYDLILKWASDPSQKVWFKNAVYTKWKHAPTPSWLEGAEYYVGPTPPPAVKSRVSITGIDGKVYSFPEPEQEVPRNGTPYSYVDVFTSKSCINTQWDDGGCDHLILSRGLVHLSEEAAREHAEALILASGGWV